MRHKNETINLSGEFQTHDTSPPAEPRPRRTRAALHAPRPASVALVALTLLFGGAAAATSSNADITIDNNGAVAVSTALLPTGLYWVTTTALLFVRPADSLGECSLITSADPNPLTQSGTPDLGTGDINVAATAPVLLSAPAALEEFCSTLGSSEGSFVRDAGITAIRIGSELAKTRLATGVPRSALMPRRAARAGHLPRR